MGFFKRERLNYDDDNLFIISKKPNNLFVPISLGLNIPATMCSQGNFFNYQAQFKMVNNAIVLDSLQVPHTGHPITINDVSPEKLEQPNTYYYHNLNYHAHFTGELLAVKKIPTELSSLLLPEKINITQNDIRLFFEDGELADKIIYPKMQIKW